jgi:hypothetical protein
MDSSSAAMEQQISKHGVIILTHPLHPLKFQLLLGHHHHHHHRISLQLVAL